MMENSERESTPSSWNTTCQISPKCNGTLMNSKVIHESERAGGMGGALSRKLRRGGSAESGCHWMVFISLEVQLLGILSILDMSPLTILFLAVTWQFNLSWDVNHLTPRFTCLGSSEPSPGSTSHATYDSDPSPYLMGQLNLTFLHTVWSQRTRPRYQQFVH